MSKANTTKRVDVEREVAQADLQRRADAQGVKPITDFDDLRGDPEVTADFDVDAFLRTVRAWRDTPSTRSIE